MQKEVARDRLSEQEGRSFLCILLSQPGAGQPGGDLKGNKGRARCIAFFFPMRL